jgi:Holliday junction DNA helicase RuvA
MISLISGSLVSLDPAASSIALRPSGPLGEALVFNLLVPAYAITRLLAQLDAPSSSQAPTPLTFCTMLTLQSPDQGTSFEPRLIAFLTPDERDFFDLFTTVKGIGTRRALRAMTKPPGWIAAAIVRSDAKALTELPEIGKRLAETIIAELTGKVDHFATRQALEAATSRPSSLPASKPAPARSSPLIELPPEVAKRAEDVVAALMRLGESRPDAERRTLKVAQDAPQATLATDQWLRQALATSR